MNIKVVRDRAWLYLDPCVAATGNMTLFQMQQFVAGTYVPEEADLKNLARRMGFAEED